MDPRVKLYDEKDFEAALHMRCLSAKARRQGKYGKGPKSFLKEDRIRFQESFIKILSKIKGNL